MPEMCKLLISIGFEYQNYTDANTLFQKFKKFQTKYPVIKKFQTNWIKNVFYSIQIKPDYSSLHHTPLQTYNQSMYFTIILYYSFLLTL